VSLPIRPGSGVPQPLLFERLEDLGPVSSPTSPIAARAAIEASIAREIGALLSTRIDPSADAVEPRDRTVLEYGLPDISAMAAQSTADQDRIARAIERAITAFEPRLSDPQVSIVPDATDRDRLMLVVAGNLHVSITPEPYAFAIDMSRRGGVHGG
jgi:type VI secretion system lysozyme-like protein